DAIRIKLLVDGTIERVGEIDPSAVAADLDHLRAAIQRAVPRRQKAGARYAAPDPHRTGELRSKRVGNVVLPQVTGPPASHIEEAIIHRQVDIGNQRRYRFEPLEHLRQLLGIGRLGWDLDDLSDRPAIAVAMPHPN